MSRRDIITADAYAQLALVVGSDHYQRLELEKALRDLTDETIRGTARVPHEFREPPTRATRPACVCGLRRAHPIHHPALRILPIDAPAGARRYDA